MTILGPYVTIFAMDGIDAKVLLVKNRLTQTQLAEKLGIDLTKLNIIINHGVLTDNQVGKLYELIRELNGAGE